MNASRPASSSSSPPLSETPRAREDRLLAADDVAQLLNVPVRFVREHTRSGAIPHLRIGRRYVRYRRESVLAWLDSLETDGRAVTPRRHAPTRSAL